MNKNVGSLQDAQQGARGFTLVELAIVLMIIGLLIGGILRGREIYHNAVMQTTIKNVMGYTAAVTTFRDNYGMYPGDMNTATSRIPNCTTATNCKNGNADGNVGAPVVTWTLGDQTLNSEGAQFWKHLAFAHLISGIKAVPSTLAWGESHPSAPYSGGFSVITGAPSGIDSVFTGALTLRLHGSLTDPNTEQDAAVASKDGMYLDTKMDDGLPGTGDVQSKGYGNGAAVAQCEVAYTSTDRLECMLSFLLAR